MENQKSKYITKEDIANFFDNVLKSEINEDFKKSLINSNYKLKSNILYLTSDCNLKCDYCYQKKERESLKEQTYITKQEINDFFYDLMQREPQNDSTVVIFGGEPFLNPNLIYYIFELTNKITYFKKKKFNLSLTTNGVYFLNTKNRDEFIEISKNLLNHFSLEISYDVSGHDRRVYKNGKSTKEDVEKVLEYFNQINYPLTIRYTIHKDNYQNALKDLIQLSLNKNYKKIVVNFYETELDSYLNVEEFKERLKRQTCEIFRKVQKPICHLNCLECMGCNFEQFDGIYYQFDSQKYEVLDNVKEFKFKK